MTAQTRAKAVMEGLAGKTLSNATLLSIATNYIGPNAGALVEGEPTALTSEETAQMFLDHMLGRARHHIKAGASRIAQDANAAVVQAASDASVVDL